jgi:hypothetical protein
MSDIEEALIDDNEYDYYNDSIEYKVYLFLYLGMLSMFIIFVLLVLFYPS